MNTTLRALIFGVAVAATLTLCLDNVTAAEKPAAIRLESVQVTAHRDAFDAEGNLKAVAVAVPSHE